MYFGETNTANTRSKWPLTVSASLILKAAQMKLAASKTELAAWEKKLSATKKLVKAAGIDFYTLPNNSCQPFVKNSYIIEMNEATRGVQKNQEQIKEYSTWVEVLKLNEKGDNRSLTVDDFEFFFAGIEHILKPEPVKKRAAKTVKAKAAVSIQKAPVKVTELKKPAAGIAQEPVPPVATVDKAPTKDSV